MTITREHNEYEIAVRKKGADLARRIQELIVGEEALSTLYALVITQEAVMHQGVAQGTNTSDRMREILDYIRDDVRRNVHFNKPEAIK